MGKVEMTGESKTALGQWSGEGRKDMGRLKGLGKIERAGEVRKDRKGRKDMENKQEMEKVERSGVGRKI